MSQVHVPFRVVIVGAGFGGIATAKELRKRISPDQAEILLINREEHFLFTPLLHEMATGMLSKEDVTIPLGELCPAHDLRFVEGVVTAIDRQKQQVTLESGTAISYDRLVIATGATTQTYGMEDLSSHAFFLKTAQDAIRLKAETKRRYLEGDLTPFSLVVVGGGPTGVELATELAEYLECLARTRQRTYTISLVSTAKALIQTFPPSMQEHALDIVQKKGIRVLFETTLAEIQSGRVMTTDGREIKSDLTAWVAGVVAQTPACEGGEPLSSVKARLCVYPTLQSIDDPRVFVLGDAALTHTANGTQDPLPMLAQIAVEQGALVAKNILASLRDQPLQTFQSRLKGLLLSLGNGKAIAVLCPFTWLGSSYTVALKGRFAWFIWRTIYLFEFPSWKKRFSVAAAWTRLLWRGRTL